MVNQLLMNVTNSKLWTTMLSINKLSTVLTQCEWQHTQLVCTVYATDTLTELEWNRMNAVCILLTIAYNDQNQTVSCAVSCSKWWLLCDSPAAGSSSVVLSLLSSEAYNSQHTHSYPMTDSLMESHDLTSFTNSAISMSSKLHLR